MISDRRPGNRTGLLAGAAALFAAVSPPVAQAQEAQLVTISVQSQALGDALNQLARQTHTQIVFRPELVRGKRAQALSGALTAEQALGRLLNGTGLTYDSSGLRAYVIQAQAVQRPTQAGAADRPAPAPAAETAEEIVLTGSRLNRTTFQTPTPVTTLSAEALEAKAPTQVMDLLRDIPALRPNVGVQQVTNIGASTSNMRSLGASRTLTLIDGRRAMDTSPTGGFDLNILPAPLIKRVEIVTAGASSVYGSDAVTGVVNVFLDSTLQGGKLDFQYNDTQKGDNPTYSLSGAVGTGFAGDRGHFVAALSVFRNPDVLYVKARDWGNEGWGLIPNTAANATNTLPRQLIAPNVRLSQMTFGGVITTAGPLKNIQFGDNGAQSIFRPGANASAVWSEGGDGPFTQPDRGILSSAAERDNAFARATFDFTSSMRGFVETLYGQTRTNQTNIENYNNGDITIKRDNAFLPANIAAIMDANRITQFSMGRINSELGRSDNFTTDTYSRSAAGLNGEFGSGWKWDANVTYTYAVYKNYSDFNRNNPNWTRALDAVIGPNGQPICRSTLTNPNDGCAPANVFGVNSLSTAAVAYASGTSWMQAYGRGLGAAANASGDLFNTWAGPVSVGVGAEYRKETINLKSDPVSAAGGWRQASSAPYRGEVSVKEAYAEAAIPLVVDKPLFQNVELDLAGRIVDYSTSGTTEVWKTGLNWTVNDQLRFRGTWSRDFRAPKIDELFAASTIRAGFTTIDRTNNTQGTPLLRQGGNPNLKPEQAHTLTGGVVVRPAFIPNLQFSVDAFDIELEDAIVLLSQQEVVDRCFAGDQALCASVVRDATGKITLVDNLAVNAQILKTRGVDLEASYSFPLSAIVSNWGGQIAIGSVASYVDKLITVNNGVSVNTAGQLIGALASPHWRSSTTVTYRNGPANVRLLASYVGAGKYDVTYTSRDINRNDFPAYVYLDASAAYDLSDRWQVYGKVENLLDQDPPIIPGATVLRASPVDSALFYDLLGRKFGVGARYKW